MQTGGMLFEKHKRRVFSYYFDMANDLSTRELAASCFLLSITSPCTVARTV